MTGWLDFGKTPTISIRAGALRIATGELYPWIASLDGIRESVKPVRSVRGVVEIATLSCDGPLREPGSWKFEAGGRVENLEVDTSLLPGPVTIPHGKFLLRPEELSFTDLEASLLDATLQGEVRLREYRKGVRRVTASLHGGIGVEAAKWGYDRFEVPHPYTPKAPFTVAGSTLSWDKGGATVVEAELAWPGGPVVSLSLRKTPGELTVDPLVIKDNASDAKVAFHLDPGTAKVKFAGALSRATIEKIVPIPVKPGQRIHGEMEADLDRANPGRSSARGTLDAVDLAIPWKPLAPLAIRGVSLTAEGRSVRMTSSDLSWDNIPFSVTGTAEFGGETVVADLKVDLCGISSLGTLTMDATGPAIDMAISASGKDLDTTMTCLSQEKISVTGTYSLSARIAGKGTGDALVRSLRGPLDLTLKDGRINRFTLLSRIFSYLNVTELLRGKLPDLKKEGFPYRTLAVRGEMSGGKFLLREAAMDAPSMGIAATGEVDILGRKENLEVLVSPFRTADTIVRWIPILRYVLGGTLVSIPIAVKGDIDNPKVTAMDPAGVGKGLLGIVERTLKVPVRVISPILPGERNGGEKTSPPP
jgi:hypothetical protein